MATNGMATLASPESSEIPIPEPHVHVLDTVNYSSTSARRGNLCVLDDTGDSRIQWDPASPEEVAKAQLRFDELKRKGYLAYKVNKRGDRGEVLQAFDPAAERIILHSPMVGG